MGKFKVWGFRTVTVVFMFLVSACGATKVELPLNVAEVMQGAGYQMPQYQADMLIVMNDDDAGLRYMAGIHDIKLQLDIGQAYKHNVLDVMDMMFADTTFSREIKYQPQISGNSESYVLEVAFQFIRVTIPRTRFGQTQAHVVTKYTLSDSKGKQLFSYTDYTFGSKSNAVLMSPGMHAFVEGEGGLAGNALQYSLLTSITKISGIIQQYMNSQTRAEVLKAIAEHGQELADGAAVYIARITGGDDLDKSRAAAELQSNFVLLAIAQNDIEQELLLLADQELASRAAGGVAKQLCACLAITGRTRYLQTFQDIMTNGKDKRVRGLAQKYYNYLLKSLCGTGDCSEETAG